MGKIPFRIKVLRIFPLKRVKLDEAGKSREKMLFAAHAALNDLFNKNPKTDECSRETLVSLIDTIKLEIIGDPDVLNTLPSFGNGAKNAFVNLFFSTDEIIGRRAKAKEIISSLKSNPIFSGNKDSSLSFDLALNCFKLYG